MGLDGLDADTFFNTPCIGYSYDDILCVPAQCAQTVPEVDLTTLFTRNLSLMSPIVSSPMDTVTESRMAILCALLGGIGVIHCRCTPERQAQEVAAVKKFESGFVMDPQVLSPADTVGAADRLAQLHGNSTVLVTEGGMMGNKLLGIVTSRDVDFVEDRTATKLADVMTPKAKLQVGFEPISLSEAVEKLKSSRKGELPILNDAGELVALVSRSDLKKSRDYPRASKDANRQLLVAAACNPRAEESERVQKLVEAGVDALVFNMAHGDAVQQIDFLKRVKHEYPSVDVVCGNVVTPRQAKPLLDAGADALRVGMACSSLYSSSEAPAVGRPQGSAVYHVAQFATERYQVPVIADGGICGATQMATALTLGASTVMCGSLLAGTSESPGEAFYQDGMRLKLYRGMGPLGALPASPAHSSCAIVDRGPAEGLLSAMLEEVKRDLRRLGVGGIPELHESLYNSNVRFQARAAGASMPR